ncbi:hypothetical protein ACP70R_005656 [Stipagrostis hirtigluma subsp. patula]
MDKPAAIRLTMALLGLLCASVHLHAQGAREATTVAAAGHAGAAEYVLLEPEPERVVAVPAAAAAANASSQTCERCSCCLKGTPGQPAVCLTTCCFNKTCTGSACTVLWASCGCDPCDFPHGK